jgi:hypothetical protein
MAPDVQGQLMSMSPQMAFDLLKRRAPNRPISKGRVRTMIIDMRSGKWVFNGEPLILSEDLTVLDGQHRLQAIYESGVTLPFMVIVGINPAPAVVMSIDQGRAKTGADMLTMHDQANAQTLASVARWLYRYERNQMCVQATGLRNGALPGYVAARPSLPTALPWGRAIRDLLPQSCAAMLFHVMSQHEAALSKRYFDDLAHGNGVSQGQPAHTVRERLLRDKSPRTHIGIVARAALVVLGWNCLRQEKPMPAGLVWRGVTDASVPFPQVL